MNERFELYLLASLLALICVIVNPALGPYATLLVAIIVLLIMVFD